MGNYIIKTVAHNYLALLVHPFKNQLYAKGRLKESADRCGRALSELLGKYSGLRLNVVMPGSALEALDGLLLSELREHQRRGALEWLITGYTEPFLSLSPTWLSRANIETGMSLVADLLGAKPGGYVPPFSNWEPLSIETLRDLGLHYVVTSSSLLPPAARARCGYWATEHLGSSVMVYPTHVAHTYNAPASLSSWLQNAFGQDPDRSERPKLTSLHFLLPLAAGADDEPYRWLRSAVRSLARTQAKYQSVLFADYLGDNPPLGLQYLVGALDVNREGAELHEFRNWLFSHEQVGLLHRRMLEVCDGVSAIRERRGSEKLVRELFTVQDINRYLPAPESGFTHLADRFWSYAKLIEVERKLPQTDRLRGGQIRIADHLRNGHKSIIMANRALKAYINHRSGGAVYELDFGGRSVNLLAAGEPGMRNMPHVILPGRTRASFIDHILPPGLLPADFAGDYKELGDFVDGWFEYKISKTTTGVRAALARQGAILQGEKNRPLNMEKVFSIERDRAELSFAYQLANNSPGPYSFTFATELSLALPGVAMGKGRLSVGRKRYEDFAWDRILLENVTDLALEDWQTGVRIALKTQKPVGIWCHPIGTPSIGYQGTALILTLPVEIGPSALWSLVGKLQVRAVRRR
ncbi:MAG: DUF1926 domain-containing protein [Chitinivibrionales bacterium]|nr:DUF1926 domain-containing protein [Chitinivibrionales bacterium]